MKSILLFSLLAALPGDERAKEFFDRIRFDKPTADSDEAKRVMDLLTRKEHWIGAHRQLERTFGMFPDNLSIDVDFDLGGEEAGHGEGRGDGGKIRFNLRVLVEQVKRTDEMEAKVKEASLRGQRITYKVPPMRMERLVYHELTHVLQRQLDAPNWFKEGMAQLMGDDPASIMAFANSGKSVQSIEAGTSDKTEDYSRGHLFWKWLESRGAAKKAGDLSCLQGRPWKDAIMEATGKSWVDVVSEEQAWSAAEAARLRK